MILPMSHLPAWLRRAAPRALGAAPLLWLAACAGSPDARPPAGAAAKCAELFADARIDPIRDKVQVPPSLETAQDVSLLSITALPTESERPAIKALWDAHIVCRRITDASEGPPPPHRARSLDALGALLGDLHDGTLSYGQFARKLLYLGAADKSAGETLEEELEARERWRALE